MKGKEEKVIISLASNYDQTRQMETARAHLVNLLQDVKFTSEHWTTPIGTTRKEPYINQLCTATTQEEPLQLIETLKALECTMGRTHNADGIVAIDLDLLQYGEVRYHLKDWDREYIKDLIKEL